MLEGLGCGFCCGFVDGEDLVGGDVFEGLDDAAGPVDFDGVGLFGCAEAEVGSLVAGGEIAAAGGDGHPLRAGGGGEFDLCADGVAVAAMADEQQGEPVVGGFDFVAEDVGGATVGGDDGVDAAIVVEVSGGEASCDPGLLEDGSGLGGDVDESVAGVVGEEHGLLVVELRVVEADGVEVVALDDEEIFAAVVVVVEEVDAPAGVEEGDASDAADVAVVGEAAVAVVFVEGIFLVGEVGDDHVGEAVVVVVLEVDAHAGEGSSVTVDGHLGGEADLFEGAVALVAVEVFEHGVVGDGDVDFAVAVEVGDGDAEAFAGFVEADFCGDFGEVAIAVVVEDEGRDGLEGVGVAVGAVAFAMLATEDVVEVPLHVAEDDEVEEAIVIEVDPGGGGGPAAASGAGLRGDVGEGAVAVVVVEMVAAVAGDVEVFVAVVVVISDRYSHVVAYALQAGLLGDIFEGAAGFLMEEAVPILWAGLLRNGAERGWIGERRSVGEEDVETSVVVVVEESDAGAHGFDEVFLRGVGGLAVEEDVAALGDVDEVAGRWFR